MQVDLYDFFGGQCYACLEDKLQTSVGNARLMDRQAVLLKGRSGKPPGPQTLFLEVCKAALKGQMSLFQEPT
jgi:hypothetical protein